MRELKNKFSPVVIVSMLLAACGGDGLTNDDGNGNPAVVVDAGEDKSVSRGETAFVEAQASSTTGVIVSTTWRVLESEHTVKLIDSDREKAYFDLTAWNDRDFIELQFTAVDSNGNTARDKVNVRVSEPASRVSCSPTNENDGVVLTYQPLIHYYEDKTEYSSEHFNANGFETIIISPSTHCKSPVPLDSVEYVFPQNVSYEQIGEDVFIDVETIEGSQVLEINYTFENGETQNDVKVLLQN